MKEIGGYIEFENYHGSMLHDKAIPLNCGRNALAYLIRSKSIQKIKIPYFLCNSVRNVCEREGVSVEYYHVGFDFNPSDNLMLKDSEWLYLVNYYGQLSNDKIQDYAETFERIIVDNTQSYFQEPVNNVDTIYTCRKYFGVADGAFLYTDSYLDEMIPQDESFERMHFLLGRFERTASEFYAEYVANNKLFATEPIKKMSKLTQNLVRGINYKTVKTIREKNYLYLHNLLQETNTLKLGAVFGTFMYPLMLENGQEIRKKLQAKKIYIPVLWPNLFEDFEACEIECNMAENILPLPIDQRYSTKDMEYMTKEVFGCIS